MQTWNFKKMNIWKYEPENDSKLVAKISLKFDWVQKIQFVQLKQVIPWRNQGD